MSDSIWEEAIEKIDQLFMCAIEADEADFSTIIKVHDDIMEVVALISEEPSYPQISQIAQKAAEIAMQIVLQESESPEYDLNVVIETCSTLQCMVREIINGLDPSSIPLPDGINIDPIQSASKDSDDDDNEDDDDENNNEDDDDDENNNEDNDDDESQQNESKIFFKIPIENINLQHIDAFISDVNDLIGIAESSILELENTPNNQKSLDSLLSVFHTIKGNAGILQIKEMVDIAHISETLLEKINHITPDIATLLFSAIDCFKEIEESLHYYVKKKKFSKITNPIKLIEEFTTTLKEIDLAKTVSDPDGPDLHDSDTSFAQTITMVPDIGMFDNDDRSKTEKMTNIKNSIANKVNKTPSKQFNIEKPPRTEKLDIKSLLYSLQGGTEEIPRLEIEEDENQKTQIIARITKVKIKDLDNLVDTISELLIAYSMIENDPKILAINDINTHKKINNGNKLIKSLQSLTLSVRMTPIQSLFQTMNRMGRDLARQLGKDIIIHLSGQHTEIDRMLIESLQEPLVHLVRNAIDHGIEDMQERINIQKTEVANIFLRAYHRKGNIIIEVEDDGRGIEVEKIKQKAARMGIEPSISEKSNWEMMIFRSGFSVKDSVSEISGRGMGLDIVKQKVESCRGRIEVLSKQGEGTKFTITLPLTLAIRDSVIMRINNGTYAIATSEVKEFIQLKTTNISTIINGGEVIEYKNQTIPLVSTAEIIDPGCVLHNKETTQIGIITVFNDKHYCLVVDEILQQQQVVVKGLGKHFKRLVGISAATILGDGSIAYILDTQNILIQYLEMQLN